MNEIAVFLEVIESDCVAAEIMSGYSCRWCCFELPVGSRFCEGCGRNFIYPTPALATIPPADTREKQLVMMMVERDRLPNALVPNRLMGEVYMQKRMNAIRGRN